MKPCKFCDLSYWTYKGSSLNQVCEGQEFLASTPCPLLHEVVLVLEKAVDKKLALSRPTLL